MKGMYVGEVNQISEFGVDEWVSVPLCVCMQGSRDPCHPINAMWFGGKVDINLTRLYGI